VVIGSINRFPPPPACPYSPLSSLRPPLPVRIRACFSPRAPLPGRAVLFEVRDRGCLLYSRFSFLFFLQPSFAQSSDDASSMGLPPLLKKKIPKQCPFPRNRLFSPALLSPPPPRSSFFGRYRALLSRGALSVRSRGNGFSSEYTRGCVFNQLEQFACLFPPEPLPS